MRRSEDRRGMGLWCSTRCGWSACLAVVVLPGRDEVRIRQGRKNPHNLYIQLGDQPSDYDPSLGYIRYPHWAAALVASVNASPGGVVRSFNADVEWDRSEELRVDRLGPEDADVQKDDPDRPVRKFS